MKRIQIYMLTFAIFAMPAIANATTEGYVTYDFEPYTDSLPIMYSYVSEYAFIDAEVAANVLFGDLQYQVDDAYDNDILVRRICAAEDAMIYSDKYGGFRYSTENAKYTREIASDFFEYPNNELTFMSQSDAILLCESTLNELGITAQAYDVKSLNVDTLIQLSNESRADLLEWQVLGKEVYIKDDWSIDDECYYIDLYNMIDGIPVTLSGYYDKKVDSYFSGTTISIIITCNGIEYIDVSNLVHLVSDGEPISSCTMQTALDGYISEKNSELTSVDIYIADMYIRYVQTFIPGENIMNSFRMIPAWTLLRSFDQNENGVIHTYLHDTYCDIATGKELRK